ncbi:NB-ARC domain-containing protein [Gloeobacter kilaueensis]|uniref:Uncharacterized protein n=1 Tax=Gloeobacter kilaueensis (strain ATCC BAA-2537 / CCAP 1431/1 / ULC 316 / JS1) TaxID=1183438 RepID=U5QCX0_GLOK1|nr:NB-ARC domain-containing protein [Gloeobacter kilaueensis]AGY56767.1 hypothetical protein GKIL_0521 [Gloeobacter kilaueensis JS1]
MPSGSVPVETALVVACELLGQKRLSAVQELILRQAWDGLTYPEIAERHGYDPGYLKDAGSKLWQALSQALGERVSKKNVHLMLVPQAQPKPLPSPTAALSLPPQWHWGDAPDVAIFYGRSEELSLLGRWLCRERCRLVVLTGMGGMGKTALAAKLAEQVKGDFEYLYWQSLRNAPRYEEVLSRILQFLSTASTALRAAETTDDLSLLVEILKQHRCLLVLDNFEAVLCEGDTGEHYREGCEGYAELLRRLAEEPHRSSLLLTSREKPRSLSVLEGDSRAVRCLKLNGLDAEAARQMLAARGHDPGFAGGWQTLFAHYGGNPLALKIASATIRDLFAGQIEPFLEQGVVVFGGIDSLLAEQLGRLSALEEQILHRLALRREPQSTEALQAAIVPAASRPRVLEALDALARRSLIEIEASGFRLSPVVLEYAVAQLVEGIYAELLGGQFVWLERYALVQTQIKDYVRDCQIQAVLAPLAQKLVSDFGSSAQAGWHLRSLIASLQSGGTSVGQSAGNLLNLLCLLKVPLVGADFSGLTIHQAFLKDADLRQVNFKDTDLSGSVFAETTGSVLSLSFHPDGQTLVTGDTANRVRLWRAADLKLLRVGDEHTSWVYSVAVSPDGRTLASGSFDRTVRLWDARDLRSRQVLTGHTDWVYAVAFSPDGSLLASAGADRCIRLWQIETGECCAILPVAGRVWSVVFLNNTLVAGGADDGSIRLWDVSSARLRARLRAHTGAVRSLAFDRRTKHLVSAGEDGVLRIWDLSRQSCLSLLRGHRSAVLCVGFTPDGQTIASGSEDRTVRLWEVASGRCLALWPVHSGRVWSIGCAADGRTIATSGDDRTLKTWALPEGQCLRTLQGYTNFVWSVACSPDGSLFAGAHEDRKVRLWAAQRPGDRPAILAGHDDEVLAVAFSPTGHWLASTGTDRSVRLWDVQTLECLRILRGHTGWGRALAFAPDGSLLASASTDGSVRLWALPAGTPAALLKGHTGEVLTVAFARSSCLLATGGIDGTVRLWDSASGQCLQVLAGHSAGVQTVAFSPDGRLIASAGHDQSLCLWEIQGGRAPNQLAATPGSRIWSIAFSPDGRMIAAGNEDRTIRLWQVADGRLLSVWHGHGGWVWSIAFSPDGRELISGSQDETVRRWNVLTGECVAVLRAERPYEGMDITGATGLSSGQRALLKDLGAVEGLAGAPRNL